jgi:homoserine trans-succinylase
MTSVQFVRHRVSKTSMYKAQEDEDKIMVFNSQSSISLNKFLINNSKKENKEKNLAKSTLSAKLILLFENWLNYPAYFSFTFIQLCRIFEMKGQ